MAENWVKLDDGTYFNNMVCEEIDYDDVEEISDVDDPTNRDHSPNSK